MTGHAPAILMVVLDQLSERWLESAAEGIVELPNLTRLREEGVVFSRAFTSTPVCTPARATMLTGLRPAVHGALDTGYRLDPALPTVPRALADAGWRTGAFGKLHLAPQLDPAPVDYTAYGFDTVHLSEDARVGAWLDWIRTEHPEHVEAALATVWMTEAPGVAGDPALQRAIEDARRSHPEVAGRGYVLPLPAELSQTAWITDRAIDFIRETPADRPLFAHVGFVQPHDPFCPPQEYLDRVDRSRIPRPYPAEWVDAPLPYHRELGLERPSYDAADWREERALYFADLAHLDDQLGRLREALAHAGRSDVLLVFTADHGELLHDHGLVGKGERHYDQVVRIPLVLHAPGLMPERREDLADSTDVAPTLLAWAGVAAPTLPVWPQGEVPMWTGRRLLAGESGRSVVYIESNTSDPERGMRRWSRTVRTHRHRYTRHLDGGGEQLFDLVEDPHEQRNLAADPDAQGLRAELLATLAEAMASERHPHGPRGLFRVGAW